MCMPGMATEFSSFRTATVAALGRVNSVYIATFAFHMLGTRNISPKRADLGQDFGEALELLRYGTIQQRAALAFDLLQLNSAVSLAC